VTTSNDIDRDRTPPEVERQLDEMRERLRLMESAHAVMAAERTQMVAERDGLLAKIHYLRRGHAPSNIDSIRKPR